MCCIVICYLDKKWPIFGCKILVILHNPTHNMSVLWSDYFEMRRLIRVSEYRWQTIYKLSDEVDWLCFHHDFWSQTSYFDFLADMYGYHGKRSLDFLRITMAMPRLIAPAKRLLEQGLKFGPFPMQSYQSYEANIDFEIRCVCLFDLYNNSTW